jgi:hypothetical protein
VWLSKYTTGRAGNPACRERNIQVTGQSFRSAAAVRHIFAQRSESAARTNHRTEQSSRRDPTSKFQPIRDDVLHAEVLGQGTHDVIERLTDQHNVSPGLHKLLHFLHTLFFESRL